MYRPPLHNWVILLEHRPQLPNSKSAYERGMNVFGGMNWVIASHSVDSKYTKRVRCQLCQWTPYTYTPTFQIIVLDLQKYLLCTYLHILISIHPKQGK